MCVQVNINKTLPLFKPAKPRNFIQVSDVCHFFSATVVAV